MLSSKIDKLIFILLLILCLIIVPPMGDTDSFISIGMIISTIISMATALALSYLYLHIRNTTFFKKVVLRINQNKEEECISLLGKAIVKQPEMWWLKSCYIIVLGLSGHYEEFSSQLLAIKAEKHFAKSKHFYYVSYLETVYQYLNSDLDAAKALEKYKILENEGFENLNMLQTIILRIVLNRPERETAIEDAKEVFESDKPFYKCVAACILWAEYTENGEMVKADGYKSKAFEYAPSDEMTQILKDFFEGNNE